METPQSRTPEPVPAVVDQEVEELTEEQKAERNMHDLLNDETNKVWFFLFLFLFLVFSFFLTTQKTETFFQTDKMSSFD